VSVTGSAGRRLGIAWKSVSNGKPIREKSIPLESFLKIFDDGDFDVVSFQRCLTKDDDRILRNRFRERLSIVPDFDESDQTGVIREILNLDCMVTISTTTAHMAACLGIQVILLAACRHGHQWFWRAQAEHNKCIYPTLNVILGNSGCDWWKKECLPRATELLLQL